MSGVSDMSFMVCAVDAQQKSLVFARDERDRCGRLNPVIVPQVIVVSKSLMIACAMGDLNTVKSTSFQQAMLTSVVRLLSW